MALTTQEALEMGATTLDVLGYMGITPEEFWEDYFEEHPEEKESL